MRYGDGEEKLFRNSDNYAELEYFKSHSMSTKEIIDSFSILTKADQKDSLLPGIKYGFLDEYSGYHSRR